MAARDYTGERSEAYLEEAEKRAKGESKEAIVAESRLPGGEDEPTPPPPAYDGGEPDPSRARSAEGDEPDPDAAGGEERLQEERPKKPGIFSKRNDIIANVARKQAAERGEEPEPAPGDEPAAGDQERQEAAPVVAKRKVKIDREEVEVTEAEYDEAARIGLTVGKKRLPELNELRRELKAGIAKMDEVVQSHRGRDSSASPPAEERPARETQQPPSRGRRGPSKEDLQKIREDFLYGDDEAGAEALFRLGQEIAATLPSADEIVEQVRTVEDEQEARSRAGKAFKDKYPDIASDQNLATLTGIRIHEMLLTGLKSVNLDPEQYSAATRDVRVARDYYQQLTTQGYELDDVAEIPDRAVKDIRSSLGKLAPTPVRIDPNNPPPRQQQQRQQPPAPGTQGQGGDRRAEKLAEKETMRQPRRASMIARNGNQQFQAPDRAEVVDRMRQSRPAYRSRG